MTDDFLFGGAIVLLGFAVGMMLSRAAFMLSDALRERRARRIVASYPPTGGIRDGGYEAARDA